jgi:hypothetical protein
VRKRQESYKQSTETGLPLAGEAIMRSPAAAGCAQPGLAAALAGSAALSRAISGNSIPDGDAKSAPPNHSPRQPRLGPDASAVSDERLAYTVNDTARLLSISRSSINKLIKLKALKTIKLLGRRLITRAAIEDLLAGHQ